MNLIIACSYEFNKNALAENCTKPAQVNATHSNRSLVQTSATHFNAVLHTFIFKSDY